MVAAAPGRAPRARRRTADRWVEEKLYAAAITAGHLPTGDDTPWPRPTDRPRRALAVQHECASPGRARGQHAETVGVIAYGAQQQNGESRS